MDEEEKLKSRMRRAIPWLWNTSSEQYWKEQVTRSGFDQRILSQMHPIEKSWKSFFFEQTLTKTLREINWDLKALSIFEKLYIAQYAASIEAFTLEGPILGIDAAHTLMSWLPNLKVLTFCQTNGLLQSPAEHHFDLIHLHSVYFSDIHRIDKKALDYIPSSVQSIIIDRARHVTCDFLDGLCEKHQLTSLKITNSCLEPYALHKVPKELQSLDLSYSAKDQDPHMLELIPHTLKTFTCNGWSQCGHNELAYLPSTIVTLSLDEWGLSDESLKMLGAMHIEHLVLSRSAMTCFSSGLWHLPKTLKSLDLSCNQLSMQDLSCMQQLVCLDTLTLNSIKLHEPFTLFPNRLKELSLSCSGPLASQTLVHIKELLDLRKLDLKGCFLENCDLEALPETIEYLDISECSAITDTGIQFLEHLSMLHTLIVDRCEQIRGFGFSTLSNALKKLSCRGCHRLSGKCLTSIPQDLEELYLDECELIETNDMNAITKTLEHCEFFGIVSTKDVQKN